MKKDCWYLPKADGKTGKGKGDKNGDGKFNGKGKGDGKKCVKCGKAGHFAKGCRSAVAQLDVDPAQPEEEAASSTHLTLPTQQIR